MTGNHELRVKTVSDLANYLSCGDYWNNLHNNILIYGNKGYGQYILPKLIAKLPFFVMELTKDEIAQHPTEVELKLNALYEKDYAEHRKQSGGTILILNEDVIETILKDFNLFKGISRAVYTLIRGGNPRHVIVIAITNRYTIGLIIDSCLYFICPTKNRRQLISYISKSHCCGSFFSLDSIIVQNADNLFVAFLKQFFEYSKCIINKVFGYKCYWTDKDRY